MKRRITFPSLFILILGTILVTSSTSAAFNQQHGPSASGEGLFRFFNPITLRLERWSFSFDARSNKNGQAKGRAEFNNLTDQTQIVVRIKCLTADSSSATISGTVLHSDDPDLPKLANVVFAVLDGQSIPNGVDMITPLFAAVENDCQDPTPLTILPVEDGEIQIQP